MPISVACPSCGSKLKANESLAGRTLKCPKCQTPVRVSSPPSPDIPEVISSGGVSFVCPDCGDRYQVGRDAPGTVVRCRRCSVYVRVPEAPTLVSGHSEPPATASVRPAQVATQSPPPPIIHHRIQPRSGKPFRFPSFKVSRGITLCLAGFALLVSAWLANAKVDDLELRQMKVDAANADSAILLARLAGRSPVLPPPTPKPDRLHVYFLAVVGALSIGFGFVCLTIEKNGAKSRKGGVP